MGPCAEHLETTTTINLIVSDVMMPVMDGFALLTQLKSHPEWCQLPVVLLTARTAQQDKLQGTEYGSR
ncbi:MAG: response regulator [Aureispira sp.]|nr:response regulator [Aureispira sp.]